MKMEEEIESGFRLSAKGSDFVDGKMAALEHGDRRLEERERDDPKTVNQNQQSEVRFLGRLSHSNLVKLLGYYWEDDELLVVYEFTPRGSLETHLFGCGSSVEPLPWDIRLKILIGAARGLAFLQTLKRLDICRGFKASNILLDGSFNSKISDFSYADLDSPESSDPYEYDDEDYFASDDQLPVKPSQTKRNRVVLALILNLYPVKSDVYCFGVVLVEMLTGSRAPKRLRQRGSVGWVKSYLADRRKLTIIMDSRLKGKYPPEAALGIAHLALNCLRANPNTMPSMKEVLKTLERINASNEQPLGTSN